MRRTLTLGEVRNPEIFDSVMWDRLSLKHRISASDDWHFQWLKTSRASHNLQTKTLLLSILSKTVLLTERLKKTSLCEYHKSPALHNWNHKNHQNITAGGTPAFRNQIHHHKPITMCCWWPVSRRATVRNNVGQRLNRDAQMSVWTVSDGYYGWEEMRAHTRLLFVQSHLTA